MKRMLKKVKDFITENKKEPWFRYVAIIVVMLFAAVGVNQWRDWQDKKEAEASGIVQTEEKEEEPSFIEQFWETSKAHFVMFGILTVLLLIVKYKKSVKLEERGGYKEKKNE